MTLKKIRIQAGLFIAVSLWAVAASAASVWLFLQHRGPGDPVRRLHWRIERAGYDWRQGSPDLPDRNSATRHGLLSIVENPREDWFARLEALSALVNMQDGTAWVPVMRELLEWADAVASDPHNPPLDRPTAMPGNIRVCARLRALEIAAPEDEVLDILKRADPGGWREFLAAETERGKTDQIRARAKHLLEIAGGATQVAPPAGPASKPAQPAVPAE